MRLRLPTGRSNESTKPSRGLVLNSGELRKEICEPDTTYSIAFDVIDLDPQKTATVQNTVANLNGAVVDAASDRTARAASREDAKAIDGMVRFLQGKSMPWRADRPAI